MKFWDRLKDYLPVLATVMVAGCAASSLSGYEAPVYEILTLETVQAAQEETEEEETEEKITKKGDFDLEDGVYEGEGTGYNGKVRVSVEIKDHTIIAINVLSKSDDDVYFNLASTLIDTIIEKQELDVDTVTGATYSSKGIIAAVKNAVTGEVDTSTAAGATAGVGQGSTSVSKVEESGEYKDGTYYGSATGFSGPIKVKVVIKNGKIKSISVVSSSDGSSYLSKAKGVIKRMISAQSTNVDTVSGATYSSVGIIKATRAALSQAAVDQEETETPESEEKTEKKVKGKFPYINGTYYGTAEGYMDDVTVAVTIKNKTITKIKVVEEHDDEAFFSRAEGVIDEILSSQSTDVDVVSGATYSSNGIIGAVKEALKEAEKATKAKEEGQETEETEETEETVETEETEETEEDDIVIENPGTLMYEDGTYEGTGNGYNGEIRVAVTIKDKTMKKIEILDSSDDPDYMEKATNGIVKTVIEKQTTEGVDAVTGATESSNGIKEAIDNALAGATPYKEPVTRTYTVTTVCEPDEDEDFEAYNLTMTVTITDGKITAVTDISGDGGSSNDSYINKAANGTSSKQGVVDQVVEKGNAEDIDTVSRATCSSNAIIEGCRNALKLYEEEMEE